MRNWNEIQGTKEHSLEPSFSFFFFFGPFFFIENEEKIFNLVIEFEKMRRKYIDFDVGIKQGTDGGDKFVEEEDDEAYHFFSLVNFNIGTI